MPRARFFGPLLASLLVHGLVVRTVGDALPLLPDPADAAPLPRVDEVDMNVGFVDAPEPEPAPEPPAPPEPEAAPRARPEPTAPAEPPPSPDPTAVADAAAPAEAASPDAASPEAPAPVPADAAPEAARPARTHELARSAHPPRLPRTPRKTTGTKSQPPCPPPVDGIATVGQQYWSVDRDLIDYYATHVAELMKLGAVYTHKDASGKLAGFRVGLPRCSILRQGGLRSGDVVQDINGVRINTVFQAIGAYFKLRDEPTLQVRVQRGQKTLTLSYDVEQKRRKRDVGQPGDYAAEALLRMQAQDAGPTARR